MTTTNKSDAELAAFHETFLYFDSEGDGRIDVKLVGIVLRAIGGLQSFTEADVAKCCEQWREQPGARISFDQFLRIYQRLVGLKDGQHVKEGGVALASVNAIPGLANNATGEQGDEMIDEDDLLEPSDLERPTAAQCVVPKPGEAPAKRRRACKDCTCGLAELQANGLPETDQQQASKSSCGSCYLGDAFRCSTCPHLGTAPFKPGEKVKLANIVDDF